MPDDRTVHGITQSGGEIVRYDRAGKWYVDYGTHRLPITLNDAVLHGVGRSTIRAVKNEQSWKDIV